MEILYGYSNCSNEKYEELFNKGVITVAQASQKYHQLLVEGLASNNVSVKCFSGLSINRNVEKKLIIKHEDEKIENIFFHYYRTVNIPVIRHLCIFFGGFFNTLRYSSGKKSSYVICDCLSLANAYGMVLGAKLTGTPAVAIVTDLPRMMYNNKIILGLANRLCGLFDGFILLTKEMNGEVNKKGKTAVVLEGHVDLNIKSLPSTTSYERTKGIKTVLYAGSLLKIYGIEILVKGFLKANIPNAKLIIYGDGDYADELREICRNNSEVQYRGTVLNSEIVKEEQKASLLVNPRPTKMEFTRFSFPSKNMEYMVSGTPMLTTNLPGMPEEYRKYVYILEDETVEGMSLCLKEIFSEDIQDREKRGKEAQQFVLREKSNYKQATRVVELLKTLKRG